jgi:hypothetical protein
MQKLHICIIVGALVALVATLVDCAGHGATPATRTTQPIARSSAAP